MTDKDTPIKGNLWSQNRRVYGTIPTVTFSMMSIWEYTSMKILMMSICCLVCGIFNICYFGEQSWVILLIGFSWMSGLTSAYYLGLECYYDKRLRSQLLEFAKEI